MVPAGAASLPTTEMRKIALSRILPTRASAAPSVFMAVFLHSRSGALVPAAAERAHQRYRALVLRRAYLQRLAAVAQFAALGVEQIELADVAVAIAHFRQRG